MNKALRTGKVLIDWNQNDHHKTTVSVYSLRVHPKPTISAPVSWQEIEKAESTAQLKVSCSARKRYSSGWKKSEISGLMWSP